MMSDGEGKEFMVHFADDRDMENIEEELELGVGNVNENLKTMGYQHEERTTETPEGRTCNPIPDQERFLPIANVARVMKRMIPSSGKIAKDAKECVQECVSEFISFITSEANDKCMSEKRKTISADDLLEAINNMGFDNYVAPLQLFLERYRAAHKLSSAFNSSNTASRTFGANSSSTGIHNGTSSSMTASRDYSSRPILMSSSHPISSSTASTHTYQATTSSHGSPDIAPSTSSSNGAPVVLAGGLAGMSVTALQQQPMQIYIDPASKQHYMAIETDQGMQLYPIQIQTDGPVAYSFAPEVSTAVASTVGSGNQTFIMMATADVDDPHASTITGQPSARGQTTTTNPSCARQAPRAHNHSDFNVRSQPHQPRPTATTGFVSHATHSDVNAQARQVTQKRQTPPGSKGSGGKVIAPPKRVRHS